VSIKQRVNSFFRVLLPRRVRQHRILHGPLAGEQIVTSWYDYPAAILGYTERPLLDWFAKNVNLGETWLDVGAHYGYTAIALSKLVGSSGRIFAFEPMLSTVGYLNQTRRVNLFQQMIIVPIALGTEPQIATMHLPVIRGMVDSTIIPAEWEETILVTSLDWLWSLICGQNRQIEGIKIDVQGMEIETLQGMQRILREFHPKLVIEFHRQVDRDELLSLVEACGYSKAAKPIEPVEGEITPRWLDDRSYAFLPIV
jgi:FkbM family methyltransferase